MNRLATVKRSTTPRFTGGNNGNGSHHEWDVKAVSVTPSAAKALLNENKYNRRVNQRKVDLYTREMRAGRWRLSNDMICISTDGQLLNGQHRLLAVVASGVTIRAYVAYAVPVADALPMDSGTLRSEGAKRNMFFGAENGKNEVAIARAIAGLAIGDSRFVFSTSELNEIIEENREEIAWAAKVLCGGKKRKGLTATVIGCLAYAYPVDSAKVKAFAEALSTGANVSMYSPALALRNQLLAEHIGRASGGERAELAARVLTAVYHHLKGHEVKCLKAQACHVEWFTKQRRKGGYDKWASSFKAGA
jgi:hypothetical protein